jgi:isopenicillin-N epimerase
METLREASAALSAGSAGDEQFWRGVKDQFIIKENFIIINAANMAPASLPVMETQFNYIRSINEDTSHENRGNIEIYRQKSREKLAVFLGADPEEIAISRNTSESNNILISGLSLGSSDDVVIWDQNHPTNNVAWDVQAERNGFTVKRVTTPPEPGSPDELINPFRDALTMRTKVLSITDFSSDTGIRLPTKELCALARQRGVLSMVDGAQTAGCLARDLHDLGCDFFTSSSQKWFSGPREAGVLYVRKEHIAHLWPMIVGVGWESAVEGGTAQKFETYGHRDDAKFAAFETAVDLLDTIGIKRIENRAYALADALRGGLSKRIPDISFYAPDKHTVNSPIVKIRVPGDEIRGVRKRMYEEHDIGCAVHGGSRPGVRFSPHFYNTMEEMDRVAEAAATLFI